jgi:hypothetical protein
MNPFRWLRDRLLGAPTAADLELLPCCHHRRDRHLDGCCYETTLFGPCLCEGPVGLQCVEAPHQVDTRCPSSGPDATVGK